MKNFLNRLLVKIIISSCLCVGFTKYKNIRLILNWLFLSRENHIIKYIRIVLGFLTELFLLVSIAYQVV